MLQPPIRRFDPTIRVMIDDYIASGLHQRIPPTHSSLLPPRRRLDWDTLTPRASAGAVYSASRTSRPRQPVAHESWPPLDATVTAIGPCPSAPGSSRAARFEILRVGATLKQLRDEGLRLGDLTRYRGAGVLSLSIDAPDGKEDLQ